jgi:hypothetical protein
MGFEELSRHFVGSVAGLKTPRYLCRSLLKQAESLRFASRQRD